MPNLNYDVAQGVAQGEPLAELILREIANNNKITRAGIAKIANVSIKTVERELGKMSNVKYVGSGYSGHWEIEE